MILQTRCSIVHLMVDIITVDNDVLRKKAELIPVEEITSPEIQKIIKDMSDALRNTKDGIGIAAPQIGISKQIFIASEEALQENPEEQKTKEEWEHYVFINPEIIKISKTKTGGSEGCLSVPQKYGQVERADKVKIKAYNEKGEQIERGASGLFARLFQHEVDHLSGVLFIDKADKVIEIENEN